MKHVDDIKTLSVQVVSDFVDWYFDGIVDMYNIGNDYFGVWGLNDEFWDFSDIVRALDNKDKLTPDELSSWYWTSVEAEKRINLNSYLMGARYEAR